VNANEIAQKIGLKHINMTMLGAFHKAYQEIPFDVAQTYYEVNVPRPRDASMEAIRQGFAQTTDQVSIKPKKESHLITTKEFLDWRPDDHAMENWPSAVEEYQHG
jgi:hypothetical protein